MGDTLPLGADNPFSVPDRTRGLTTAANLWLAAAVVITCVTGRWTLALFTLALSLLALAPLERLEKRHQTEA